MEQFTEFAGNNLLLIAALVVILALLAHNILTDIGNEASVSPTRATELINRNDAVVVDVRPIADFSKSHIINSINIPMSTLSNQLSQLEKHKKVPIILACRSGAQSYAACKTLSKNGFEDVYNLKGGILAWESANLPVRRK
jgi:rhodanese-related sulfurtransferase